jgi:4-hydroxy-tetrahydrodipicolinate reductase
MLRVAVMGATGRVGRRVVEQVLNEPDLTLVAAMTHHGSSALGQDAGALVGQPECGVDISPVQAVDADVVIDFSVPQGLVDWMGQQSTPTPLVTGTTGLSADQQAELRAWSERAPVVAASNFATGIVILRSLLHQAAQRLEDWDVEILEAHHRHKRDAPSGTALTLAETLQDARGGRVICGREGEAGPRAQEEIGIHSIRAGETTGWHSVWLAGAGERLELSHTATSRSAFSSGALRAARWVIHQPPGTYDLPDVLEL